MLRDDEFAEWVRAAAGGDPDLFRERLAWGGLSHDVARHAGPPANVDTPWRETLHLALERADAHAPESAEPLDDLVRPFVTLGTERVRPVVAASFTPQALDGLRADLERTLRFLFHQPDAVLESVERSRALWGGAHGQATRLRRLVDRFPVAGRLAARAVERWVSDVTQFAADYAADADALARTFGVSPDAPIVRVETGLSDPHGGRTVKVAAFSGGRRVVYKPRPMGVELAFQQLIEWANEAGLSPRLRSLAMLVRPDHAWVEYVEQDAGPDDDARGDLYRRGGALLCLAHVLKGTDFHHENIMVSGDHPVLVDLEMLAQPDLAVERSETARRVVTTQLEASVLETALLPSYHIDTNGALLGGGGLAWGLAPFAAQETPDSEAPPTAGEALLQSHLDDVVEGFTDAYRLVLAHRDELVGPGGAIRAFEGQWVRFVFRPTRVYGRLAQAATRPKRLLRETSRRIALEALFLSPLRDGRREMIPVLHAERDALDDMDIPVFHVRTDSTSLNVGGRTIERLFDRPSYEAVRDRVEALSEADLAWQVRLIEASVGGRKSSGDVARPTSTAPSVGGGTSGDFEAVAFELADGLIDRATYDAEGGLSWVARVRRGRDRYCVQVIPNSLFDGTAGVALFLSACGAAGHERAREAAEAAFRPLCEGLARRDIGVRFRALFSLGTAAGAAEGIPSIAYALAHAAAFLDRADLLDVAARSVDLLRPEDVTASLDVYDGAAGLILGLAGLDGTTGDDRARALAVSAGEHLLRAREPWGSTGVRVWRTLDGGTYTGFAHGASGIAAALLRLHDLAPDAALLGAARDAFAFERALFDPERGDWRDFPDEPPGTGRPTRAWCHGAAGIGLARLQALRGPLGAGRPEASELSRDVEQALASIDPDALGSNDSVCCGSFGQVEFLHEAERAGFTSGGAARLASAVLRRRHAHGTFAVGGSEGLNPGFFQGVAGIGYTLLRLAHPGRFPNVLLWE